MTMTLTPVWQPVAVRVFATREHDRWDWHISDNDQAALRAAVAVGRATMAQRREPDGTWVLLAKRIEAGPGMARKASPRGRQAVLASGSTGSGAPIARNRKVGSPMPLDTPANAQIGVASGETGPGQEKHRKIPDRLTRAS